MSVSNLVSKLSEVRKAVVALCGTASMLVASGTLGGPLAGYVTAVLAVLTALGVYSAPNEKAATGVFAKPVDASTLAALVGPVDPAPAAAVDPAAPSA